MGPVRSRSCPGLVHTLLSILEFLLWALALGLVLMALSIALRILMRRRRMDAMRVEEIILGPDDTATPYEVMSALDAIHGQLLTRYAGSSMGQNPWSFEIVRDQDRGIHFLLAAPYQWLTAIEDIWRSKYTNIRLRPTPCPPPRRGGGCRNPPLRSRDSACGLSASLRWCGADPLPAGLLAWRSRPMARFPFQKAGPMRKCKSYDYCGFYPLSRVA